MSRFEGEFQPAGDGMIALPELLRVLADTALPERQRQAAIACYLSASDGWRDAGQLLGGAFADDARPADGEPGEDEAGLSGGKEA
ncbi:MAG: hypothetical protein ABIR77_04760 [Sphingomicrobium sp.]